MTTATATVAVVLETVGLLDSDSLTCPPGQLAQFKRPRFQPFLIAVNTENEFVIHTYWPLGIGVVSKSTVCKIRDLPGASVSTVGLPDLRERMLIIGHSYGTPLGANSWHNWASDAASF